MRSASAALLVALLAAPAAAQQPSAGRLVLDVWDVAYLPSGRAGFVHTAVHEREQNGKKVYRTTVEINLTVKRFNDVIQLRMVNGTDETADGKVTGTLMRLFLGKDKQMTLTGKVEGDVLVREQDGKPLKQAKWADDVLGLHRQVRMFQDRRVKPGDRFVYRSYEPSVEAVVRATVEVKDFEEVELFGGKEKKKLLRAETRIDRIGDVQLPLLVSWLDEDLLPARSHAAVPGLGELTLYRTTRVGATAPGPVADLTDIGVGNFVKLPRRIVRPEAVREATYAVAVKGDDDPATTFSRDGRQQVKNAKGDRFELVVRADAPPPADGEGKAPGDEFIESSYFINSADLKVQTHARKAVGAEADPWKKALLIEKWVHDHMATRSHEAMATADHVARTLEGDCSEYAMLTAAMCRAAGVPSRTAIGLIYADTGAGPVFAFHMWTEVWVRGRWVGIDATRGAGPVGATHLKITHHSWHDVRTVAPVLPLQRVLGKVSIDVVSVR